MPRDYKAMQLGSAKARTENARRRDLDKAITALVVAAPELSEEQITALARLFRERGDRE